MLNLLVLSLAIDLVHMRDKSKRKPNSRAWESRHVRLNFAFAYILYFTHGLAGGYSSETVRRNAVAGTRIRPF